MIRKCTKCGNPVMINGLGRKPLNIPLKNVCESVIKHYSVGLAAEELNCSESYIFKVLKVNGLTLKDVLKNESSHL